MLYVRPENLTDRELVRHCDNMAYGTGMPLEYQRELLKRFAATLRLNDPPIHQLPNYNLDL